MLCNSFHALLPLMQQFRSPVRNPDRRPLEILGIPLLRYSVRRQCLGVRIAFGHPPHATKPCTRPQPSKALYPKPTWRHPKRALDCPNRPSSSLFPTHVVSATSRLLTCRVPHFVRSSEVDSRSNRPCTSTSLHLVSFAPSSQVSLIHLSRVIADITVP